MEIIRAKHAGICYGVKRALEIAQEAAKGSERTYTLGPLIHNPLVVEDLKQRGVGVMDVDSDVEPGIAIIRSHGVEPQVISKIRDRGFVVVDATCPHVAKAQYAAANLQATCDRVVIIGAAEHPEVKGIAAHAGDKALVISDVHDLPADMQGVIGVVVQTTESREKLEAVVAALESMGVEAVVKNTICSATKSRQKAAMELSGNVDAMVVVGGKNSSNTTHLFEICQRVAPKAYFVESAAELTSDMFEGCETIGVSAGASTPEDQIHAVEVGIASFFN